jgi:hypothetical protein
MGRDDMNNDMDFDLNFDTDEGDGIGDEGADGQNVDLSNH